LNPTHCTFDTNKKCTTQKKFIVCTFRLTRNYGIFCLDCRKKKKKTGDVTASEPLEKKARIEEPDQTQVQDATNETDSASTQNFTGWTLSKLLEHVEDPLHMKNLVTSLEQRLEDGEMEQLESKLQSCALKNTVFLTMKPLGNMDQWGTDKIFKIQKP
ncbi:hypothetical protein ANANG_G00119130, partial [Anguilla anguilla]